MGSEMCIRDRVWDGYSECDRNFLESSEIDGARVVTSALKGKQPGYLSRKNFLESILVLKEKFINLKWYLS